MKRFFALTFALLFLSPGLAYSDISMNIWDDGTNLYMSATGNYDLTNANQLGPTSLGANAVVGPNYPLFGWETNNGPFYGANYSGVLSGFANVFPATTTSTTNPFYFWNAIGGIAFSSGGLTGSVNEFATFNNVTLSSLGMVAGESISVSWGLGGVNERGSINVGAVPEPGSLLVLGSLIFAGAVHHRRLRN